MERIQWWQDAVCYEVYVPSFQDSDADGIGDLPGIIRRLPYLHDIGIDAIWLTPFYPSPKVDNGYDVANYCAIDPLYGTLADFDTLVREAEKLDIRIIIDLVLNHTSSAHAWFEVAQKDKQSPYYDYYIWRDRPINNWESYFGGSAWEYNAQTNSYYYHAFAKEQVDLNWTNPAVLAEFKQIFDFWIARGVAGFRLDVINFLTTDNAYLEKNNPIDVDDKQQHLYDQNHPSIYEMLQKLSSYIKSENPAVFLIGEVGSEDVTLLQTYAKQSGLDVIFNFNLGSIKTFLIADYLQELQNTYQQFVTTELTLFFSSHDMSRAISRLAKNNPETAKQLLVLQLLLKGVPFIYQGEEIGQQDVEIKSVTDMQDIQGVQHYKVARENGKTDTEALEISLDKTRDYSRGTIHWDNTIYNGFSTQKPWMLTNTTPRRTVESEQTQADSFLHFFRKLTTIRREYPSLRRGIITDLTEADGMLHFIRKNAEEELVVYLHFGTEVKAITMVATEQIILNVGYIDGQLKPSGILVYKKIEKSE